MKSQHELQEKVQKLQLLIDKLSCSNEDLKTIVEKEQLKNQEKNTFLIQKSRQALIGDIINSIAHQWRQPLNSISLAAANVAISVELDEDKREIIETTNLIVKIAGDLAQTMTDFMEFFNQEDIPVKIDLNEVLNSIIDMLQTQLYKKNIKIKNEIDDQITINTYKNDLQYVFLGVISSIIKSFADHEPENRKIIIRAWPSNNSAYQLMIEISHNAGVILSKKEPAYELDIINHIIQEALGGELKIYDKNGNTHFIIYLPKRVKEMDKK
ncbi:sensor histidine kinase [Candidatus Contubernalis alkaliaceticus]|uniref:hypothetical protein n=1 Tax=Candidatus Contubernalis alkaliaceticus TaxID=338645 RepID=UPI001F4C40FE|nr:hypothetical protein [Candidatus Contubernalis alkalaceticus]UNC92012.1 HAMP domain-containing histidine kinase [Candidatus Contubernalis alkalaceticus]